MMKIYEVFPEISADWLLLGKGEMSIENKTSDSDNTFLKKQLLDQAEMMGLYKKLPEEKDARIKLLETLINSKAKNPSKDKK